MNSLITFKSFNDKNIANEIAKILIDKGIECIVEDNSHFHNQVLAGTTFDNLINLKLRPESFNTAREVLHNYYKDVVEFTQKDYYLFNFTNEELQQVISKPEEWGEFNYQLSKKILNDRGIIINKEIVDSISENHSEAIFQKEEIKSGLIIQGYLYALLGGFGAIFLGYNLANSKKTLLNGKQMYTYNASDRRHGQRIYLIGCVSLILWVLIILYSKYSKFSEE